MAFAKEVSKEARRIHEEAVVIDGCSFFCEGYNDNLKASGITALNITVPEPADDVDNAVRRIADYYQVIRSDPKLRLIEAVDDIFAAKQGARVGIIIGFQNSRPMHHYDIGSMVEVFHRLGTRIAVLAYNDRSFAADGCVVEANAGLSREGRILVQEFNRIGIVIDCSHTGERSSLEAIDLSEKPCIFSHSNPKAKSNQKRNITDEQIKNIASRGGVIGLTPPPCAGTGARYRLPWTIFSIASSTLWTWRA